MSIPVKIVLFLIVYLLASGVNLFWTLTKASDGWLGFTLWNIFIAGAYTIFLLVG